MLMPQFTPVRYSTDHMRSSLLASYFVSLSMPMERSMESIMGSMAFMFLPSSSDMNPPEASVPAGAAVLSPLSGVAASMAGSFGAQAEAHSITAIIAANSFFIVSSLKRQRMKCMPSSCIIAPEAAAVF